MFTAPLLLGVLSSPSANSPAVPRWSELDHELAALATTTEDRSGPRVSGWLRSRYAYSSDVDAGAAPGAQDLSGFNLDDVRLVVSGSAAPGWTYTVSMEGGDALTSDATSPGFGLLDAYTSIALGENASVSVGRFSATFLWNSGIPENQMLFLDRSFVDEASDGRDVGFEFSAWTGPWRGWAAMQNGSDGAADRMALSARASCQILGSQLAGQEGTCDLGDETRLAVGAAWYDDTRLDEGTILAADASFASGAWSASAEWVDYGDDKRIAPAVNTATGALVPGALGATGASSAWDLTASYAIVPRSWELAARFQDLDDDGGTTIASACVVHFVAGHAIKWTAQFDHASSDDATLDVDAAAIGLAVGY